MPVRTLDPSRNILFDFSRKVAAWSIVRAGIVEIFLVLSITMLVGSIVSTCDGDGSKLPCGVLLLKFSFAHTLPVQSSIMNKSMEAKSGTERGLCMLKREPSNSQQQWMVVLQNCASTYQCSASQKTF